MVQVKHYKTSYLGHFGRFNLFDLEEISDREEGDGHGADADHKYDQRWTAAYVGLQILQRIQQEHLHTGEPRLVWTENKTQKRQCSHSCGFMFHKDQQRILSDTEHR